jgi:hypothetical protein
MPQIEKRPFMGGTMRQPDRSRQGIGLLSVSDMAVLSPGLGPKDTVGG